MSLYESLLGCGYKVEENGGSTHPPVTNLLVQSIQDPSSRCVLKVLPGDHLHGVYNLLEVDIPFRLSHPHIIQGVDIIPTCKDILEGISVITMRGDNTDIYGDEYHNTLLLYKLAHALNFLHKNRIVHLDIKPANIVMKESEPYLIDFGLSVILPQANSVLIAQSALCSADFRPPEISDYGGEYGTFTDVWSFGIYMLYIASEFNTGVVFTHNNDFYTGEGRVNIPVIKSRYGSWENFIECYVKSKNLRDALVKILKLDYRERPTMEQVLQLDIFKPFTESVKISGEVKYPTIPKEVKFPRFFPELLHGIRSVYANYSLVRKVKPLSLFYTVDMLMRVSQQIDYKYKENWIPICAACITLGCKHGLYSPHVLKILELVNQAFAYYEDNPITIEDIIYAEEIVITKLRGILYNSTAYDACITIDDLKYAIERIMDYPYYFDTGIYGVINTINTYRNINSPKLSDIDTIYLGDVMPLYYK